MDTTLTISCLLSAVDMTICHRPLMEFPTVMGLTVELLTKISSFFLRLFLLVHSVSTTEQVSKWKFVTRSRVISLINMTMWINLTFGMVVAITRKSLVLCPGDTIVCWKERLMGFASGGLGDKNSERNATHGQLAHEMSEGKKNSTTDWTRGHPRGIWVSNATSFW